MGKERRSFSDEFKRDAARRVAAGEFGLSHIARDLGIHPSLLQTWRRKYAATGSTKAGIEPPADSLEDENRRLRRENAALREDREILKKVYWYNSARSSL